MRGSLKAQLLLAPLLAAALPTRQEVNTPHALINLDINNSEDDVALPEPTLRLNIHESTSPCGYGNVTLNDRTLAQDESGAGSGSITTEQGNIIIANWGFTCVHLEDEFQGQLMTFDVISVDDRKVDDVGFVVQFQQMAPVSVSLINGTGSTVEVPVPAENTQSSPNKETSTNLDNELAELKSMMRQLAALEYAISSKVHHISETYDFKFKRPGHPHHSISDCDSLKCVVKTMYVRAKHMASKIYGIPGFEREGHFGGGPGRHHWPFHHREGHHGHRPHWMLEHHENGTHPFPPHHRPHHPPHGPPHGPHGPHGEPSFHHPPPSCDCGPPPPPPPPPPPHPDFFHGEHPHGHPPPPPPPPPPPHHHPEDEPHHEHPGPDGGFHKEMGPPEDFDEERPERPLFEEGGHPSPNHHGGPPHEGHGPHGPHHPPPFGPPGLFHTISIIHIGAVIILLGFLISALHTRCFTASRRNRRSGCAGRRGARGLRCQHDDGFWATRRDAINARYCEIIRWVKEGARRDELEEEEKEAIMRQIHGSDSEDDALSTTMEQEIAQFRAAASVVGDIVEAEEGRSRSREFPREMQQHHSPQPSTAPIPPSPTSAFPDYASIDEELPAYDEGSDDSRFVADGFRYTPGSSCYTPTESSSTGSSLDEHLGRKD